MVIWPAQGGENVKLKDLDGAHGKIQEVDSKGMVPHIEMSG